MMFSQRRKWDSCDAPDCNNSAVATIKGLATRPPHDPWHVLLPRVCHWHLKDTRWLTGEGYKITRMNVAELEARTPRPMPPAKTQPPEGTPDNGTN